MGLNSPILILNIATQSIMEMGDVLPSIARVGKVAKEPEVQQVMLEGQVLSWFSNSSGMELLSTRATVPVCSRCSLESHTCKMINPTPIADDAGGRCCSNTLGACCTRCCFEKSLSWAQQHARVEHVILPSIVIRIDGGSKHAKHQRWVRAGRGGNAAEA